MADWNPSQYLKFAGERTRPARDLAAAVAIDEPERVLDAGCGPGNSTAVLARRWPGAKLTGLDFSPEMLETARAKLPGIPFVQGDMGGDLSALGQFDVVYSNAALQWLPDGGEGALNLFRLVKPGGALAAQVPCSQPLARQAGGRLENGSAHRLMAETAKEPRFAPYTAGVQRLYTMDGERIYSLFPAETAALSLWETCYCHALDGYDALSEWFRGSGMRPYLDALPDEGERSAFIRRFTERAAEEFPLAGDGRLLLWFRRLFFVAYKPEER